MIGLHSRVSTPAQITYFNVTKIPLTSYSAVVKPGGCRGSLAECAEVRGSFQPNVATVCEAAFNFSAGSQNVTGAPSSQYHKHKCAGFSSFLRTGMPSIRLGNVLTGLPVPSLKNFVSPSSFAVGLKSLLPAGSLVVDCNSTNATLSTLDLCVSRVDPSVYVLFPYPGSPGVKVIVMSPNRACVSSFPRLPYMAESLTLTLS